MENSRKEQKVVHHDRLLLFIQSDTELQVENELSNFDLSDGEHSVALEPFSDSCGSDYEVDRPDDPKPQLQDDVVPRRTHPRRNRRARTLPDNIPWSAIDIQFLRLDSHFSF